MVSNSAKLDCRTKQHTQFGVSASNGSRDMARTKVAEKKEKKRKKEKRKMDMDETIWHPLRGSLIITRQVLGRTVCDRGVIPELWSNNEVNLEPLRLTVPEIWPGQYRGGKKDKIKKKDNEANLNGKQQCKIRLQDQAAHSIWSLCE